jgi:iron(III) transport system permease protein
LKRPEPGISARRWVLPAAGLATAAVFLAPLVYLAWNAVSGEMPSLGDGKIAGPLLRSVTLATCTALVSAGVGFTLAWITTRTDVAGRRIFLVAAALPLAIPSYIGAAALRAAFGQGGLVPWIPRPSGFWGALLTLSALTYPYVYIPVAVRLLRMSGSLEDAARLLGDSRAAIARKVVLPQLRLSLWAGSLIAFLYALSDFGAVSLMRYDTVTRVIYSTRLTDRDTALFLGLCLGALAILIALTERQIVRKDEGGGFPIGSGRIYPLGRGRTLVAAVTGGFLGLILLSPIAVFAVWWWRGSAAAGATLGELGEGLVDLVEPAIGSVIAGTLAGLAAMLVLLPAAYLQRQDRSFSATVSSVGITATFALPGVVLALAMVYWVLQAPAPIAALYQTLPLLILVYVVHFGIQSHRASVDAIAALPSRYGEAAKMLGARPVRRFLTVEGPLIAPGVIAGGGLVMLSTLKELPATLLLAPIGFETLATRVWGAAEEGFLAEVGATSLVLIMLSAALTWLLILRPANLVDRN